MDRGTQPADSRMAHKQRRLNSMVNAWNLLKNKVWFDYKSVAANEDELRTRMQAACNTIDKEVVLNHIKNMPERLQAVIDARGFCTKY